MRHKTKKLDLEYQSILDQINYEKDKEALRLAHEHVGQFTRLVAGNIVLINKQILFEIIEKRLYETKVKIEDLFLITNAPQGQEGDQLLETPYGKLRVFFINQPLRRSWLLHRSKFNYPKISKVKVKSTSQVVDEAVAAHGLDPFKKHDITSKANDILKQKFGYET